jgi:hypothetical protein
MIVLSNSAVVPTAAIGTVIGALTVYDADGTARTAYLSLTEDEAGLFRIVGNNLVTMRTSMAPGLYSVRVKAVAQYVRLSDDADFVIAVAPKASSLLSMAADESGAEDTGVSVAAVSIGE